MSDVPTGVKVISVLYYIGAAFSMILAVIVSLGAQIILGLLNLGGKPVGTFGTVLSIMIGLFFLLIAVLNFFIGRGLWKGKNWSRIVAIIFAIIGLIGSIWLLFLQGEWNGIIWLVMNGLIGAYLIFSRKVKEAFVY